MKSLSRGQKSSTTGEHPDSMIFHCISTHHCPGVVSPCVNLLEFPLVALSSHACLHSLISQMSEYQSMVGAISTRSTETVVFPGASIPAPPYDLAYRGGKLDLPHASAPTKIKPTLQEQIYVFHLHDQFSRTIAELGTVQRAPLQPVPAHALPVVQKAADVGPPNGAPTGPSLRRKKFGLIQDVRDYNHYDLVVEVIRIYPSSDGSVELYVSDYTSCGLLFHYRSPEEEAAIGLDRHSRGGNDRSWPGPFGKMTLQVKLWPPHGPWVQQHVRTEMFVFLRNVHIKVGMHGRLEGAMHEDRRYLGRVDVSTLRLDHPDVRAVLRRKQEYQLQRTADCQQDAVGAKQSRVSRKKTRKRTEKRERELREAEQRLEVQRADAGARLQLNQNGTCLGVRATFVPFRH